MEAHDITLSRAYGNRMHDVITTSMPDEARPRKGQQHLKLP